jgi:beta-glucosidase
VWDLECLTVLDGLRSAVEDVIHDDGADAERAASVAAGADVAVVVVGYTCLDEGEYIGQSDQSLLALFPKADEPDVVERFRASLDDLPDIVKPARLAERPKGFSIGGDRSSLRLAAADVELIRAVAAANPRTVVAIQAGSAVVTTDWLDAVPAVVQAWYGGCQAGPGLADVLLGNVNPSARLPFSVPSDEGDLPPFDRDASRVTYDRWHGWRHLARSGTAPAFPFGFGLSYTRFTLADVGVTTAPDTVTVRGAVRNEGDRDGTDVVQIYAELPDTDAPPRLVGFTRVEVRTHQAATFEVTVPVDRLATRDGQRRAWHRAGGRHRFVVARFAGDPDATTVAVDIA